MKKFYLTFLACIIFSVPNWVFAALGDFGNPATSCKEILESNSSASSGEYYLKTNSMSSARKMYCNMSDAWWWWMLLFQRRWWNQNTESCGTHLNNFLQNSCWDTTNLAYGDSYSSDVDLTLSQFGHIEYLVLQEDASWNKDSDDNYIIQSESNIFPNSNTGQNNFNVNAVCNVSKSNCDTEDVKWIYVWTSWFNSSRCLADNYAGSTSYKGNYGYCHNGFWNYYANWLFWNREQYNETKLWWHYNGARNYMERVYIRIWNFAPNNFRLSSDTIPTGSPAGTQIGILQADDNEGDTLIYAFTSGIWDDDNSDFTISWNELRIISSPNANVKDIYSVRISVSDGHNIPVEKEFAIYISWGTYLGSILNPAPSCLAIKNANASAQSWLYYLRAPTMSSSQRMYCDMERNGGGWILAFQRAGWTRNVESCGTDLNNFLHNGCGSVESLNYNNSYSANMTDVFTHFTPNEYMNIQYSSTMLADTDDAYIIQSSSNIFPNSTWIVNNIPVSSVCDINGSNCDTSDVYWKYVGDSFYSSARCNSWYASRWSYNPPLEWDFWYCQNGLGSYTSNGLFWNRSGYNEVKLWYFNTGSQYMERVYIRDSNNDTQAPNISSYSPGSWSLLPTKNINITYSYSDEKSWIDVWSAQLKIYKMSWGIWGTDISSTIISNTLISGTWAKYESVFPDYGKYKISFTVKDYAGNIALQEHILFIDQVEFNIGTWTVDIGSLSHQSRIDSPEVILTVKTIWAAFDIDIIKWENLSFSSELINGWDGNSGYGYQLEPYSWSLKKLLNTKEIIFSEGKNIHPDGQLRTYQYKLKFFWKAKQEQFAGEYLWDVDFWIQFQY